MIMYSFVEQLKQVQDRVNHVLREKLSQNEPSKLLEAMEYAVLLGGKRIRPFLVYATGKMLGASSEALDAPAAAIEAIHAYSLIHDDLPSMDDDNLRRGQPTCHIAFDEATAILAGDALQPFAFELIATSEKLTDSQKVKLTKILAENAGVKGMCFGQSLDLEAENKEIDLLSLERIHQHKTGNLLRAAVKMGFVCSEYAHDALIEKALDDYATAIGLAFQVQDDILDIEGDSAVLGKTVGADIQAHKSTYPKFLGLAGAKEKANALYETALLALDNVPFDTTTLRELAKFVVNRQA